MNSELGFGLINKILDCSNHRIFNYFSDSSLFFCNKFTYSFLTVWFHSRVNQAGWNIKLWLDFLNTLLFDYPCFNDFKTFHIESRCFRLPLSRNFSLDWALMFWLMLLLSLQWNKSLCFFSNKTHNWFKVREEVVWDKLIVFVTKFRQFDPVSLANQLLARFKIL